MFVVAVSRRVFQLARIGPPRGSSARRPGEDIGGEVTDPATQGDNDIFIFNVSIFEIRVTLRMTLSRLPALHWSAAFTNSMSNYRQELSRPSIRNTASRQLYQQVK